MKLEVRVLENTNPATEKKTTYIVIGETGNSIVLETSSEAKIEKLKALLNGKQIQKTDTLENKNK